MKHTSFECTKCHGLKGKWVYPKDGTEPRWTDCKECKGTGRRKRVL